MYTVVAFNDFALVVAPALPLRGMLGAVGGSATAIECVHLAHHALLGGLAVGAGVDLLVEVVQAVINLLQREVAVAALVRGLRL